MSLTYRCPECKTPISYTADMAGELTACPGCQELVTLPAKGSSGKSAPGPIPTLGPLPVPATGPIPIPKTGPTAPPPIPKTTVNAPPAVPRTTASNAPSIPKTTVNEPPPMPRKSSKAAAPPIAPTQAVQVPSDAFDDLDRPNKRRPRDREPEPRSSNTGLFVAVGVIGLLFVAGAIAVVAMLMMNGGGDTAKDKDKDKDARSDDKNKKEKEKDSKAKDSEEKDSKEKDSKEKDALVKDGPDRKDKDKVKDKDEDKGGTDPQPEEKTGKLPPEQVYKRLLRSTAFVSVAGGRSAGSGSLVDRKEGLVVTNYHVIRGNKRVVVFFPEYEGNELQTSPGYYLNREATLGIPAEVVKESAPRDLALLKLSRVPPGRMQVRLARSSAEPGATVMSIGASGIEPGPDGRLSRGLLWRSTKGNVRIVAKQQLNLGTFLMNCWCVEADSGINQGDSGGPVADDRCRQMAVVSSYDPRKRNVSTFIDIREVRGLMEEHLDRKLDDGDELPEPDDSAQLPRLRMALKNGDSNTKRDAVRKMGAMGRMPRTRCPTCSMRGTSPTRVWGATSLRRWS